MAARPGATESTRRRGCYDCLVTQLSEQPHSLELALRILEGTPAALRALAGPSDPARDAGGWGVHEITAHLLDVNGFVFGARTRLVVERDNPGIPPVNLDGRVEASGHLERELTEVLEELARARAVDVAWLRSLTPAALARVGRHAEVGPISASEFVHFWAHHDLVHLRQVGAALQSVLLPFIGAQAAFLEEV